MAQCIDDQSANNQVAEKETRNVVEEFLAYMQMSPAERIRARILSDMNLSEEDLRNLPADERRKIEAIIAEQIRQETQNRLEQSVHNKKTLSPLA